MGLLGTNVSQQLNFTVTTSVGTVYTHGLGFTPTVVLLTVFGTMNTGTVPVATGYTAANATTVTIMCSQTNVDVLCGRLHSLIQ